eukprot:scaffold259_cov252-Pinguiococcus_pyrenoidosus.AAC.8
MCRFRTVPPKKGTGARICGTSPPPKFSKNFVVESPREFAPPAPPLERADAGWPDRVSSVATTASARYSARAKQFSRPWTSKEGRTFAPLLRSAAGAPSVSSTFSLSLSSAASALETLTPSSSNASLKAAVDALKIASGSSLQRKSTRTLLSLRPLFPFDELPRPNKVFEVCPAFRCVADSGVVGGQQT